MRYPYRGESVSCPVCTSPRNYKVASLDRRLKILPTFACCICGLLYTNPMPTDAELDDYYSADYRLDYHGAVDTPSTRHLQKQKRLAQERVGQLAGMLQEGSRTLDFGCGTGECITSLLALGCDAHGFDPNHTYGSFAAMIHGSRVNVQGWQETSYCGTFDLVSCFHVLEHLRDPLSAIRRMAEWTRPNGLVYIEVPDIGISDPNKGFGNFHYAHLIGFNHFNLVLAARSVGLQPRRIISPTSIVFEHKGTDSNGSGETGEYSGEAELTEKGRLLTDKLYGSSRAGLNFLLYYPRKYARRMQHRG